MLKIVGIFSFIMIALAVMMSGCLESSDSPKFRIDGDNDVMVDLYGKFMIIPIDQSDNDKVSYKVCWNDGTCCCVKSVATSAIVPIKHAWFVSGNYIITVTATYDDNSTATVTKMVTIRD